MEDLTSVWYFPSGPWRSRSWIHWDPLLVTRVWAGIVSRNLGSCLESLLPGLKNGVRNVGKPLVITEINLGTAERGLMPRKHH